jgi:hypothetical protein
VYIDLSEEEAHMLILKGLGLDLDATLKTRGNLHVLTSPHQIVIHLPGENRSIFRPPTQEIPDSCFTVDGLPDEDIDLDNAFEENLDGT